MADCWGEECFIFEDGFTHINCDGFYNVVDDVEVEVLDTRERQQADLRLLGDAPVIEILSDASRGIATHHRFRPVGVEDAHGEVGLDNRTATNEHKAVGANAFVAVAPGNGAGLWVGDGVLHDINIDIVVAATVHLGEWNLHRLRMIILLR